MIKFITEEYLRDLYRKEPFDTYKLQQGQRLTPGAAQYLSDKKIKLITDDSKEKPHNQIKAVKQVQAVKQDEKINSNLNLSLKKKLCCKLRSIEATFLVTSSEILKEDISLAQNVISLGRKISNIRNVVEGKGTLEPVFFKECTDMNSLNFTTELEDCFEITEFHMQLDKSNVILKTHVLRCALRELHFEIIDAYENDDDDLKDRIINNVNSIINSLSQLICSAVGGKQCQRKI
ncbi:ATP--cob(I)alamin adenosyltransferase [Clostridium scatologenes]|uniref:Cobalamin adenosyltransferase n=1 Tax=Clostridium scatologenes TaxID=1548 RepID=A0A0E3K410_CLOSL|nr:ATP--cob(I)alamin adenosyltransferase [Clostridium scatologenes]AKA71612.1 hypothetical protein CSCA_4487 [Clostridium scatologenes]